MKSLVTSTLRYLGHKPWPLASQFRTKISVSLTPIQSVPLHSTVSINLFGLSGFLMNSVACVAKACKNAGEGHETACKCTLAPLSPFVPPPGRTPSRIRLLACLFNLSVWKRKETGCYAGYEFRFRFSLSQPGTGGCLMFTMLTANTSAFHRDDTKKCQISNRILGGSCRDAPVIHWEEKRIV